METNPNSPFSIQQLYHPNPTSSSNYSYSPSNTSRTNRIFREPSPRDGSSRSPPKVSVLETKLSNSGATHDTRISYSPQGCTLYYNEGIAISPPKILDSLSPVKQHLTKSNQILEYQNALLMRQLQQRDDVINLFKKGWTPSTQPINESIVRSLNLQLSHKSVLIEQVHRNLEEFQHFMTKQKPQISPMCLEKFRTLQQLIHTHEHRPILISQRILEPVRMGQQWHIQMQSTYQQLSCVKQKLLWFERQNRILESTINGLKAHKSRGDSSQLKFYQVEIQKFQNQVIIFQQQIHNYQSQISSLNYRIQELYAYLDKQEKNGSFNKVMPDHLFCQTKIDQINKNYAIRLSQMQKEIQDSTRKIEQYESLNKSYILEIEKWKKHVDEAEDYIKQLLEQVQLLQRQNSDWKSKKQAFAKLEEENSRLSLQIKRLLSTIDSMKLESQKLSSEYKTTLVTVESYKKQVSSYSIRIDSLVKERDNEALKWQEILKTKQNEYKQGISKLNVQIQQLKQKLKVSINSDVQKKLNGEIESLKKQLADLKYLRQSESKSHELAISRMKQDYESTINRLRLQIEGYKNQISKLNSQRQAKIKESVSSIQITFEQRISALTKTIEQYKLQIESFKKIKSQREWELEIEKIKRDNQIKVNELWGKLTKAEDYIDACTKQASLKIEALEKLLAEQRNKKESDDYLYKVDSRFEQVGKYLMEISTKNSRISAEETHFWEAYMAKRKKEMQEMQFTINNSLKTFTNIEQTVIVKREEMHRLDIVKLEDLVKEINVLKSNKERTESAIREDIENKFYGMLKSVASTSPGSSRITLR